MNSEVYSWKDKNGKIYFGDRKVDGVGQKKIQLKVPKSNWIHYKIDINDVDQILTQQERDQIQNDVKSVYRFFDKKLYFDIYKTIPVKIRLYEKQKNYQYYLKNQYDNDSKHSRGIYFSSTNEIVVILNQKERWRTFWTIKHETSHAIADILTPFLPAWLNEGLAENMESLNVNNGKLLLQPHNENYKSARWAHNKGRKLKVKQLLSLNSKKYYSRLKQRQTPQQSQTGELVRMLLSTSTGRSFINRLIHTYQRGSRKYGSFLVDEHYIGGIFKLQSDWNKWVTRSTSKQIQL